jgi:peptidoglycan hydrolase CwlO-like protein
MSDIIIAVIIAAITGSGGTAVIVAFLNRKKNKADTTDSLVKTAMSLADSLDEQIDKMRKELDELQAYNRYIREALEAYTKNYLTLAEWRNEFANHNKGS